ncbi:NAD-dependent epimerase/dehydratase family protein [Isoptericola croceus]|uniref:NAD-dependent epimerase/dehydratase family protein n=1 Tax=Isoptericola croceus TaxID=3031406 RepID=UPI0023F7A0EA|nr:NAD(P)-dependent oxidoreductase [Isoptericola croceus]
MRAVVLGGSGFIGSAVAAGCAAAGWQVRTVSRRPGAADPSTHVVAADLTEPGAVRSAVADADVVFPLVLHTGGGTWRAADGAAAARVNVGVLTEVAEAAPSATIVFAGSTSQVGPRAPELVRGDEPDAPATPYDRQKTQAERIVLDAGGVSLRLPTVYGPAPGAVDRGVVTAMARRALAGDPLTVWGDGAMRRDLLFVDDVAAALLEAVPCARSLAGRSWVLGTGAGVSVRELFELVAAKVGALTGRPPVRVGSVPPPEHASAMDLRGLVADPGAFAAVTGWRPRTSLAEGVDRTVRAAISSVVSP